MTLSLTAARVDAASLWAGPPSPVEDAYAVPVLLAGGSGGAVASLQFTLSVRAQDFEVLDVVSGSVATAANKEVMFSQEGDTLRVIVAGLNQSAIEGGEIAVVYLSPREGDKAPEAMQPADVVFASPEGNAVPQDAPEAEKEGDPAAPVPDVPASPHANPAASAAPTPSAPTASSATLDSGIGGMIPGYGDGLAGQASNGSAGLKPARGGSNVLPAAPQPPSSLAPPEPVRETPDAYASPPSPASAQSAPQERPVLARRVPPAARPRLAGLAPVQTPEAAAAPAGTSPIELPAPEHTALALPSQRTDPLAPASRRNAQEMMRLLQWVSLGIGLALSGLLLGGLWLFKRMILGPKRRSGAKRG